MPSIMATKKPSKAASSKPQWPKTYISYKIQMIRVK